jgi:hypothetical protein
VRTVVIVIVLPLAQLVIEQANVVGDAIFVEQLIELLVVDSVAELDALLRTSFFLNPELYDALLRAAGEIDS